MSLPSRSVNQKTRSNIYIKFYNVICMSVQIMLNVYALQYLSDSQWQWNVDGWVVIADWPQDAVVVFEKIVRQIGQIDAGFVSEI